MSVVHVPVIILHGLLHVFVAWSQSEDASPVDESMPVQPAAPQLPAAAEGQAQ